MAKVTPGELTPLTLPRSRGEFYVRETRWGFVAQKWPRKRGKPKTPYDFYKQTEFGLAARWASSVIGEQLDSATLLSKGSQMIPRDFLVQGVMGVAMQIQLEDGTKLIPSRLVNPNPQLVLDLITTLPGSWLVRTSAGWERSPAPSGLPMVTTLRRTTDATPASSTQHIVTWQDAPIDDNGAWDPANPTRINIPAAATRIRIDYSLRMSANAGARNWNILLLDPGAGGDPLFTGEIRGERTNTSSLPYAQVGSTGWQPNPGDAYWRLSWNWNVNTNVGYLTGSTVTLQCYY